jgi:hypothetical protein
MRASRARGIVGLLVAGGLGLTGCQASAQGADSGDGEGAPAAFHPDEAGGPGLITLSAEAEQRLGIETMPVSDGQPSAIPYGGVVYDNEGAAWAFVRIEERTYQRAPITVTDIEGEQALLGSGPPAGTEVVIVGAAELVGVEAGFTGGE